MSTSYGQWLPGQKQHTQPDQEWQRSRFNLLRKHQEARLYEIEGKAERLGLERALSVAMRREGLDFVIEKSTPSLRRVQLRRFGTVLRPHLIEHADTRAAGRDP